jgi:hypothetical protein
VILTERTCHTGLTPFLTYFPTEEPRPSLQVCLVLEAGTWVPRAGGGGSSGIDPKPDLSSEVWREGSQVPSREVTCLRAPPGKSILTDHETTLGNHCHIYPAVRGSRVPPGAASNTP